MARRENTPYHHGSLETALVDACIRLVGEKGIDGFSLAEAARMAGVSVAAPYRHFDGKRALLGAVARRGFDELGARLRAVLADAASSGQDSAETLTDLGLAYVRYATDEPATFTVMFAVREREGMTGPGLAALRPLGEALDRLEREGRLTVPLDTAMRSAWAIVHGLATLLIGGVRTMSEEDSELLRRQILAPLVHGGLSTPTPPAKRPRGPSSSGR